MNGRYLFLDESGHHGLKAINQEFPIFLLCGSIMEQSCFHSEFTTRVNELKLEYFGSTEVILHSRDIRKWQGEFQSLGDPKLRHRFYQDLDNLISNAQFAIVAAAILKKDLIQQYGPRAENPYNICLAFLLERTIFCLDTIGCQSVKVVAEARGKKEDSSLQSQYQRIISSGTSYIKSKRFQEKFIDINFVKKEENNLGTQLCDLVAYPIATKVLFPDRENLAFNIIEPKIYRQFPGGDYLDYGLKIFP